MSGAGRFRPLRGAMGNALLWGLGWFLAGLAVFVTLRLAGIVPRASWADGLGLAIKTGFWGGLAGGVFSSVIRLVYRGRRLSEISWVRFGIVGGIVTGVFVPVALQTLNVLFGDGPIAWHLVLDDGLWTAVFGAAAAGSSLKLAQRVDRAQLPSGEA